MRSDSVEINLLLALPPAPPSEGLRPVATIEVSRGPYLSPRT
jgi:hypothetical protein